MNLKMPPENENHPGRHPVSRIILYAISLLISSIITTTRSGIYSAAYSGSILMIVFCLPLPFTGTMDLITQFLTRSFLLCQTNHTHNLKFPGWFNLVALPSHFFYHFTPLAMFLDLLSTNFFRIFWAKKLRFDRIYSFFSCLRHLNLLY
jgi:hypothetical protein